MKRYYPLLRLMMAFISYELIALVPAWAQSADQTKQELINLQNEWTTALVKGDVGFLEKLYASEFRVTAMDGSVADRDASIAKFTNQLVKPESIESDNEQVALYDQVAVVTGRQYLKGTYKGNYGEVRLRFTNVFVRRDGRWQMVTHHSTEVRQK